MHTEKKMLTDMALRGYIPIITERGIQYQYKSFSKNGEGKTNCTPHKKPVELIQWLIRSYSNEGDLILDNCIGSGTTAVAAIKEKRHFIGMELNKDYYDIACKRINDLLQEKPLF